MMTSNKACETVCGMTDSTIYNRCRAVRRGMRADAGDELLLP